PSEVAHAGAGGLSGWPLRARSTEVIRRVYSRTRGALPIVGVGGVSDLEDLWEKLAAGATLVQVYTALVYEGPSLAARLNRALAARMVREGIATLRELVGSAGGAAGGATLHPLG